VLWGSAVHAANIQTIKWSPTRIFFIGMYLEHKRRRDITASLRGEILSGWLFRLRCLQFAKFLGRAEVL
jgi:hypothetical protein